MTKKQTGKDNHSWKDLDESIILHLYTVDGYSLKHIAHHFGVSRTVIRLRLKKNNIKLRNFFRAT